SKRCPRCSGSLPAASVTRLASRWSASGWRSPRPTASTVPHPSNAGASPAACTWSPAADDRPRRRPPSGPGSTGPSAASRSARATARAFEQIEALQKRLELENEYPREEVTRAGAFGELIGQSPALEAVARQIDLVAPTDSGVLILGESGTGKELVAREIHRR